ncbi:MAG: ABC transporter ATP-binding protein [Candidatus Manganitrophus sp.]|nr:ABC transporter ATP-binding protein [Candidatus Manganitrophus sp.]WDT69266.1 MAG: ABC transporter ATP-binding protein [Candidatus Manganitrophus sp.]
MPEPILQVQQLKTHFYLMEGVVPAVEEVSFDLHRGETLGLVGESGSGKSVTALSILRLVPDPPGKIVGGRILFEGKDLLALPEKEMRKIRGNRISMIFQEPMTSLNPVLTIGEQIAEGIVLHENVGKKEAMNQSIEMLRKVEIPAPERRVREYPHQLSGGMRQRVMIAMALAMRPDILIADEPTTALDVTIQRQILDLIGKLQEDIGMAVLLITHNLGIIAETAQRVVVMKEGRVVETSDVFSLFEKPQHPYTRQLLAAVPRLGETKKWSKKRKEFAST